MFVPFPDWEISRFCFNTEQIDEKYSLENTRS